MSRGDDCLDFVKIQEALLRKDEDMKMWCPSSGEDVGRMIESRGTDEWYIVCPTCGKKWAGGSTVLPDHNRPRRPRTSTVRGGGSVGMELGRMALAQLVEEAPDVEAAKFAATALDPIVFPGDEIEFVDGLGEAGAQSEDQQTEEP